MERGITQKDFAKSIDMQPSHINEIIKGKRSVTMLIADKFEEALGIPSISWVNLQTQYDYDTKAIEKRELKEIEAKNEIDDYNISFDIKTVVERFSVDVEKPFAQLLNELKTMLGLPEPAELQLATGRFKKSLKTGLDDRMLMTWVLLAKHQSSKTVVTGIYDKNKNDKLISELKSVFNENKDTIGRVQRIFSNYGIKFNIVPKVEKASVDGFSFMDNGIPSIVLTMRYNMIDHLAFDTFHEFGHIDLQHLNGENDSKISIEGYEEDPEEKEANQYAASILIPDKQWKTAPKVRMNPFSIQRDYTKWANDNNINKWIVLGRISKETGMYKFKSDNSRKVG
ncbi:helix-turn-helix domain-containing protein [Phocaeicola sp.]